MIFPTTPTSCPEDNLARNCYVARRESPCRNSAHCSYRPVRGGRAPGRICKRRSELRLARTSDHTGSFHYLLETSPYQREGDGLECSGSAPCPPVTRSG